MKVIDQEMFDSEIRGSQTGKLYIVDFFAEWCAPCKMLLPIFEELQDIYVDTVTIVKLDIDAHQELTEELGITSVPTVMMYAHGQRLETVVGVQPREFWITKIDTLLAARQLNSGVE